MRVSSGTYYGYSGRLKDNQGKPKKQAPKVDVSLDYMARKKFSECSCTKMILLDKGFFVDHYDNAGNYCSGSGETKDFWKY